MRLYIKERRQAAGVFQAQLARAMGVNQSVVFRWEHGEHNPAADKLPKLAEIFHCTVNELYTPPAADAAS